MINKRFISLFFAFIFLFSISVPVIADDFDYYTMEEINRVDERVDEVDEILADITERIENIENSETGEPNPTSSTEETIQVVEENPTLDEMLQDSVLVDAVMMPLSVVAPVDSSDTTGLKAVLLEFLGEYDPVVVEYRYTNGQNYQYLREIQPDYVWLCSCALLIVIVYCVFKAGGALICQL